MVAEVEDVARRPVSAGARLKPDVIGPVGLAALVIGITSPAIGLYAFWGPIEAATGPIAPLVFLAALLILLPTALSYASLNRHAPSAGASASWLWTTVNPTVGLIAGLVMMTYFIMAAITCPLMFGLFFRDLLVRLHIAIPDLAALMLGLMLHSAVVGWICLRGAAASIKTTIRLMLIEVGVVFALSVTILWVKAGQPGGLNLGPFNPAHATQGPAGFWAALLLGILCFTGFDVVATATEEARAPREHVPRVLVGAIVAVALFWAFNVWALTLSTPTDAVAAYNAQGLTAITPVAHAYWGRGDMVVILTAFTGLSAIYIASVQGASRIIFALARHGLLPAPFAVLRGEQRVPSLAVVFVVAVCVAVGAVSLAILRNGVDAFVWWSNALVFFATLTFTGVNVANLLYFRRVLPERFGVWRNLVAPVIGVGLNLYVIYAAFFSALWNAPFRTGRSVVIVSLILFAVELCAAGWFRLFRRERLAGEAPIGA